MVAQAHLLLLDAKTYKPVTAEASPILEPLKVCPRLTEKFQLHLLKLSGTECKIPRCNLISKRLSNLANAKRNLLSGSSLHILKVDKDALCCLRS